jgi:hypothetical protein
MHGRSGLEKHGSVKSYTYVKDRVLTRQVRPAVREPKLVRYRLSRARINRWPARLESGVAGNFCVGDRAVAGHNDINSSEIFLAGSAI